LSVDGQPNPKMSLTLSAADLEALYGPYDQSTYQLVLELLRPEDVVLDIGAGELRFSHQMARSANKVYAVEINELVLQQGLAAYNPLPDNLIPIHADAQTLDFPLGTTVGVLLMRHCTHFRLYYDKLREVGAHRLITNARWHMSMEVVDLHAEPTSFREGGLGWYACLCGATGFKVGPAEQWSNEMDRTTNEVSSCRRCMEVPNIENTMSFYRRTPVRCERPQGVTLAPHVICLANHAGENPCEFEPNGSNSQETLRYSQGDILERL
jgi:SAM-dependent methyltransferase